MTFLVDAQMPYDLEFVGPVTENLSIYIQTKDFARSVMKKYPQLKEVIGYESGENERELLEKWNQKVRVNVYSHTLKISSYGDNAFDTEQLLYGTANTFLSESQKYYDTRNRFDFDILESPFVYEKVSFWNYVMSGLLGLVMVFFSTFLPVGRSFPSRKKLVWRSLDEDKIEDRHQETSPSDSGKKEFSSLLEFPDSVTELFQRERKEEKEKEQKIKEFREFKGEILPIVSQEKSSPDLVDKKALSSYSRGFVPMNLPIVEEEFFEEKGSSEIKKTASLESLTEEKEPSNEEYKRRLNELLRGRMI